MCKFDICLTDCKKYLMCFLPNNEANNNIRIKSLKNKKNTILFVR